MGFGKANNIYDAYVIFYQVQLSHNTMNLIEQLLVAIVANELVVHTYKHISNLPTILLDEPLCCLMQCSGILLIKHNEY